MKTFNDFGSAMDWGKVVMKKANDLYIETLARQIYVDSDEFTYRNTGDMYDSGNNDFNFKEGLIIERTPYVRRRYYEGGTPGKNKNARPKWFEETTRRHKREYQEMYSKVLEKCK